MRAFSGISVPELRYACSGLHNNGAHHAERDGYIGGFSVVGDLGSEADPVVRRSRNANNNPNEVTMAVRMLQSDENGTLRLGTFALEGNP